MHVCMCMYLLCALVVLLCAKPCTPASTTYESACSQVCYGPADNLLVTAGYDQAVKAWDCRSRTYDAIQTMKPFADSVTSVAITDRCMPGPLQAI